MEQLILDILAEIRAGHVVDDRALTRLIHAAVKRDGVDKRAYAKRRLLPYCQQVRAQDRERWESWGVAPELEGRLLDALRMKPRRSASGVATITVITKPWPCGSDCLYCPNDVRMPKSYLHREPACERAEQNFFDPYLQVASRLTALTQMGHATDKVELIVLGGTWSDYPRAYQVWFVSELFRALNEGADALGEGARERRSRYEEAGFKRGEAELEGFCGAAQRAVDAGELSYNRAVRDLYGTAAPWRMAATRQAAGMDGLERLQHENEGARHRVVGLVFETRPDAITPESLMLARRLGATKMQMGVQSLDQAILDANDRGLSVGRIREAFELLRAFGFKIHAHAMANLLGSTPEGDKRDYRELVGGAAYKPDEVKLYPCALIESARLTSCYRAGSWRPYTEDELLDVLSADVAATPAFCRISRMVRDFSSGDIMVGNKKPNLRQMVEERLGSAGLAPRVREIRFREVGTGPVDIGGLVLDEVPYGTSNTRERFLQWVAPDGRIAGFCRLSLPDPGYVSAHAGELPVRQGEAMIREVHVYGMATHLGEDGRAAQHLGLGRKLVERACEIARDEGYVAVNVISAVGTRAYYRGLGFEDAGLYQRRRLQP